MKCSLNIVQYDDPVSTQKHFLTKLISSVLKKLFKSHSTGGAVIVDFYVNCQNFVANPDIGREERHRANQFA